MHLNKFFNTTERETEERHTERERERERGERERLRINGTEAKGGGGGGKSEYMVVGRMIEIRDKWIYVFTNNTVKILASTIIE